MNLPAPVLDAIRQAVADELAQQRPAGGADSMALEGGQQLAADGTVTYDFAGHIHAQGLDLDAGVYTTPPDQDSIRWIRTTDGALVARIGTAGSDAASGNDTRQLLLSTAEATLAHMAQLELYSDLSALTRSAVRGKAGAKTFLLMDDAGQSSFLQLLTAGQLALQILDTGTRQVNGGAAVAAGGAWIDTYNHALGRTPVFAVPILTGSGTVVGNVIPDRVNTRTATQVSFAYRFVNGASSAAGATVQFLVLLIG